MNIVERKGNIPDPDFEDLVPGRRPDDDCKENRP